MPAAPSVTGVAPMFIVADVVRTAEWYRDHLGFEIGDYYREDHGPHDETDTSHAQPGEALFVIVNANGHRLMLGRSEKPGLAVPPARALRSYAPDAYFWVDGIEALFEAVGATGVKFGHDLYLQPYGLAEFQVEDCDGRPVTFGGVPAS